MGKVWKRGSGTTLCRQCTVYDVVIVNGSRRARLVWAALSALGSLGSSRTPASYGLGLPADLGGIYPLFPLEETFFSTI